MVIHPDLTLNTKGRFIRRSDSFFGVGHIVTTWRCGPLSVSRQVWTGTFSSRIPEIRTVARGWYTVELGDFLKLGRHRRWES